MSELKGTVVIFCKSFDVGLISGGRESDHRTPFSCIFGSIPTYYKFSVYVPICLAFQMDGWIREISGKGVVTYIDNADAWKRTGLDEAKSVPLHACMGFFLISPSNVTAGVTAFQD